jgi:hypothetical protein
VRPLLPRQLHQALRDLVIHARRQVQRAGACTRSFVGST